VPSELEALAAERETAIVLAEHVLATHGGPFDRAALERALSSS